LSPEEENKPIVEVVKSPHDDKPPDLLRPMTVLDPDDLINRTYLTDPDESGQRFRAKIVQKIIDTEEAKDKDPAKVRFLVKIDGDAADEIVAYNDILHHLEEEMTDPADKLWHFKEILAHEGPLSSDDNSYKGSSYNVMVLWEDGSRTFEPLNLIAADCPVECALCAACNNLLDTPGWKRFKSIARHEQKMTRMLKQARLQSIQHGPIFHCGFQVP